MAIQHNLGYPRIGKKRELKFALEAFWAGDINEQALEQTAADIRQQNWQQQKHLDWQPVGDFSLYDQMLDMSFSLGHVPRRASLNDGDEIGAYFRVARGRSALDGHEHCVHAGEMTKWFDTNYHYIVPELTPKQTFSANPKRLVAQITEAKAQGLNPKPVIIGPISYLYLSKTDDGASALNHLEALLPAYQQLLQALADEGITWVQIDEPILVTQLSKGWPEALEKAYQVLGQSPVNILLASYFGDLQENLPLACKLNIAGLHLDCISGVNEAPKAIELLQQNQVLSLGVIDGRNIWKTDLNKTLAWLQPLANSLGERLWLAPSCSLLHVPIDLNLEQKLPAEIKNWLAFAEQKLQDLDVLTTAINSGQQGVAKALTENQQAIDSRKQSKLVHNPSVQKAFKNLGSTSCERQSPYAVRHKKQQQTLQLPMFPCTTIGSFPQTTAIRKARLAFKKQSISQYDYQDQMQQEIAYAIEQQEALELGVLVHGEPERNDMVEYFGEQ